MKITTLEEVAISHEANCNKLPASLENYNAKFCSGYGQYHTNNPTAKNRKPYIAVSIEEIICMIERPPSVTKGNGQWVIFSDQLGESGRNLNYLKETNAKYGCLWADIDDNSGSTIAELGVITSDIVNSDYIVYTSRSATEDNQKARILIPLKESCTAEQFEVLQEILNDKLASLGVVPDRATETANQVCYLPNKGEYYAHDICDFIGSFDWRDWDFEIKEHQERLEEQQAQLKVQAEQARLKTIQRKEAGLSSPIDAFNESYSVELMLDTYGYRKRSGRYLSPNSESGTAGVTVQDNKWFSNHGSDIGIGGTDSNGKAFGDAFDLYVHYNHGGNRGSALKIIGQKLTIDGISITKYNQREYMVRKTEAETIAKLEEMAAEDPTATTAVDLFNTLNLPPFPIDMLPAPIASYAKDQAELIGVDPAVIGMAAIGAAAACIDDRIKIQPKRFDPTWTESARLWIGIIGDPSAKKSPGISKAMGPLFKVDQQWREETGIALQEWEKACDEAGKDGEHPPRPIERRLIVNDATVEKMGDIMSKSEPRGILSYQDELSGWLSSMDAYKNGGGKDRAAWLEAYNGGPKSIDRISRGSTFIENWSACVIGGIQPSVVQAYANSTNHDGMLQRFTLVQAGEASTGVDRSPDMDARQKYYDLMHHLADTTVVNEAVVTLSEAAHKAREALDEKLHKITRSHPNKFLTAALGKWNGLYARLLLTFHCIETSANKDYPTLREVSGETARRVADLMWRTLLPHAVKFYQGLDPVEDTARELAALILAHGWERFTVKRDLNRNWRASRKLKPWELEETLDRLEAFGWLFPDPGKLNEKGKPVAYLVNPGVHIRFTDYAVKERERRKEITEVMQELKA